MNNKNNSFIKKSIGVFSASVIIAITAFSVLDCITIPQIFIALSILLGVMVLLKFSINKNYEFYQRVCISYIGVWTVFIFWSFCISKSLSLDTIWQDFVLCILAVAVLIVMLYTVGKEKNTSESNSIKLMDIQRYDYDRITSFLDNVDVLGINSSWGNGKTTLMNYIMENHDVNKYIYINIHLLSCNLDEFQVNLIESMERELYQNHVYPSNSKRLRNIIDGNAMFKHFMALFSANEGAFFAVLDDFKGELSKLDKTIVIVYEDIDRITEIKHIKTIFDVSDYIKCNNIKIIYQYDEENLSRLENGCLTYEYLEKYIPCDIKLTPIDLENTIYFLMDNHKNKDKWLSRFSKDDFDFLHNNIFIDYELGKLFSLSNASLPPLLPEKPVIRKIEQYLNEVYLLLTSEPKYNDKENKRIVFVVLYLKHFWHDYYLYLREGVSVLDCFSFCYKDNYVTLPKLIADKRQENNINSGYSCQRQSRNRNKDCVREEQREFTEFINWQDENRRHHNRICLSIISLLGYKIMLDEVDYRKPVDDESKNNLSAHETNDKIDRLIWSILYSGVEFMSDYQVVINRMWNEVLCLPDAKLRKDKFNELYSDYYARRVSDKKGAKGVFLLGENCFQSLFRAFSIGNANREQWDAFIDFFIEQKTPKKITIELVELLFYIPIHYKSIYFKVIKLFAGLEVLGNMNDDLSYRSFLRKYLRNLSNIGIMNTFDVEYIDNSSKPEMFKQMALEYTLPGMKAELINMKKNLNYIEKATEDIDMIIAFIEKNHDIIISEERAVRHEPKVTVTERGSRYHNQEQYDELISIYESQGDEVFMQKVKEYYSLDKISIYELDALMKKIKTENNE